MKWYEIKGYREKRWLRARFDISAGATAENLDEHHTNLSWPQAWELMRSFGVREASIEHELRGALRDRDK